MTKATKSKDTITPDLLQSIIQTQMLSAKEAAETYLESRESWIATRTRYWTNRRKIGTRHYDILNERIIENDRNVEAVRYVEELISQILSNPFPCKRVGFFALAYKLLPSIRWRAKNGKYAWDIIFDDYNLPKNLTVRFPEKEEVIDIMGVEKALLEIAGERSQFPSNEASKVLVWHQKSATFKGVKCALEGRGWQWKVAKVSGKATKVIARPKVTVK